MLKLEQDLRLGFMVLRLCFAYKIVYRYWQIMRPGANARQTRPWWRSERGHRVTIGVRVFTLVLL